MKQEILDLAASVLSMESEALLENSKPVEEIDGYYFWSNGRGGISVLINGEGEKLAAGSAISYEKLLAAFLEGKRN